MGCTTVCWHLYVCMYWCAWIQKCVCPCGSVEVCKCATMYLPQTVAKTAFWQESLSGTVQECHTTSPSPYWDHQTLLNCHKSSAQILHHRQHLIQSHSNCTLEGGAQGRHPQLHQKCTHATEHLVGLHYLGLYCGLHLRDHWCPWHQAPVGLGASPDARGSL